MRAERSMRWATVEREGCTSGAAMLAMCVYFAGFVFRNRRWRGNVAVSTGDGDRSFRARIGYLLDAGELV